MPTIESKRARAHEAAAEALILPIFEGTGGKPAPGPGVADAGKAIGTDLVAAAATARLKGKIGDTLALSTSGRIPARTVILTGMGKKAEAEATQVRRAAMYAAALASKLASAASTLPQIGDHPTASARAFAEGMLLGSYAFTAYKSEPEEATSLERVIALTERSDRRTDDALKAGKIHADAANWVRDLVNIPAADCTPEFLADHGRNIAKAFGMECKIWNKADLERGNFGGILAVAQGSALEPRMIELRYKGAADGARPVALTGKGITFDSGGLNIKKAKWMEHMKDDMAGGATALGVMRAAAQLSLKLNLHAAIPSAENMPGANAIRQGDVIRHRNGKTSEMWHTDAEGRMLLTDALAYLAEQKPRAIIDSATLTGTGLGEDLWAVMSNDQKLVDSLREAGEAAGEPGWQLPLWQPYKRHTESPVADIRNADWEGADTIAGALFLGEFVDGIPWAHLDVGDTAWLDSARDEWPEGATGSPTRVILRYLEGLAGSRR